MSPLVVSKMKIAILEKSVTMGRSAASLSVPLAHVPREPSAMHAIIESSAHVCHPCKEMATAFAIDVSTLEIPPNEELNG